MRDTDFVTVFPTGVNTAATFNRALMRQRGIAMGMEHRGEEMLYCTFVIMTLTQTTLQVKESTSH